MKETKKKDIKRARRHARIRTEIVGTDARPRLSVFRSNKFIYAQVIDDAKSVTLAAASDAGIAKGTKVEKAKQVGMLVAEAAKKAKITKVVFDRGGFLYKGRVQALADGAREGGLEF
jgi:large subunit ribosomal protein L18